MDTCARYARLAHDYDPTDDAAQQLLGIAERRGGAERDGVPVRKTRLAATNHRRRLGVGAMILLLPSAHRGYLIIPEYVIARGFGAGKRVSTLQLGVGMPMGNINYLVPEPDSMVMEPSTGAPTSPVERATFFTSGGRFRFQLGVQRNFGVRGALRLHGGLGVGFLVVAQATGVANFFFHLSPEVGLTCLIGRAAVGASAVASYLTVGDDPSQRLGVGLLPHLSVGF